MHKMSRRKKMEQKWRDEREKKNVEWWAKYNTYLKSFKWRDKRLRVLKRDNHECKACCRRDAVAVHHLTYDRVFDEPLYDLVSICETCHEALHPHLKKSGHALPAKPKYAYPSIGEPIAGVKPFRPSFVDDK